MTRALLQQALDALDKLLHCEDTCTCSGRLAIAALQAAIDAPEPEPKCVARIEVLGKNWRLDYLSLPVGMHSLYAQTYTYAAPVKPLTDEQIIQIAQTNVAAEPGRDGYILPLSFARAIEAAHGIVQPDKSAEKTDWSAA